MKRSALEAFAQVPTTDEMEERRLLKYLVGTPASLISKHSRLLRRVVRSSTRLRIVSNYSTRRLGSAGRVMVMTSLLNFENLSSVSSYWIISEVTGKVVQSRCHEIRSSRWMELLQSQLETYTSTSTLCNGDAANLISFAIMACLNKKCWTIAKRSGSQLNRGRNATTCDRVAPSGAPLSICN